ncbi:short chain dehydrogenase/ reductase [Aspergillus taichungensis]|uniref:Short chain dehydrogenase/ reductase n=1 Tax=Aspergillus taichungensis TaxID=482145 RepID=A0A2J5IAJ2_9EURO|nr:short chain dehydrogenase/ reductase [Aspergillus taichungensis]
MSTRVTGTAFITGSGSGIGQKTASTLAQNGISNLALLDINTVRLESTRNVLTARFPNVGVEILTADVRDEASVEAAVQKIVARFGGIEIAVHSAGISGKTPDSDENSLANWQKVIDTNQTGVWLCQRAVVRQMQKQEDRGGRLGRGAIVNLSSMFGISVPPPEMGLFPYTSAKHAVEAITKYAAKAHAAEGIRINAMCPNVVDTPMTHNAIKDGLFDKTLDQTPMGRCGTLEEIADSILYLVSPMSSYVTGASLVADGGRTA